MSETVLEQPQPLQQIKEGKVNVSGIAIREGKSRNNIKYTSEELDKFATTLTNRPILKDHDARVDNAVGLVTNSFSPDKGKTVHYTGWVKEDGTKVLEKIQDKRIKEVSIGALATIVKESDDSDVYMATKMMGVELSLVPVPGIVGTSISQALESIKINGKQKLPIVESINLFQVMEMEDEFKCKDCGKTFKNKPALDSHYEEAHESVKTLNKESYEKHVTALKEMGVVVKHSTFEGYESEVKGKMDEKLLQEKDAELKKLQEENAAFKQEKKEKAVAEYKKLVEEKGIQAKDVSGMTTEVIENLNGHLRDIKVDLTQSRIPHVTQTGRGHITETTKYGTPALVTEEGYIVERSDNGKYSISCDPAKMKTEGIRWKLNKNPSPGYI